MSSVNKPAKAAAGTPAKRDPEGSRERILAAAMAEFSERGLEGARVDRIARRAAANKRMLYHYFGNKDDLFLRVLEEAYAEIRSAEQALHLEHLEPMAAMIRLIEFTFDYLTRAPHFARLLTSENLHRATHLARSERIREMHSTLIDTLRRVLRRGVREGVFRRRVDPVQLFISMTGVSYFYFSNIYTLSAILGRDLREADELRRRRAHAVEIVLGYLRPPAPAKGRATTAAEMIAGHER